MLYKPLCSCLAFSCAEHIVRHSCNSGLGIKPAGSFGNDSNFLACHQFVSSLLITWNLNTDYDALGISLQQMSKIFNSKILTFAMQNKFRCRTKF